MDEANFQNTVSTDSRQVLRPISKNAYINHNTRALMALRFKTPGFECILTVVCIELHACLTIYKLVYF